MKNWSIYQQNIFDAYENTKNNLFIKATAGCFGENTPVLMYDGSIKMIQDIKVGDKVMGPDSEPREVLKVNNGNSLLYKVQPIKGEEWVCNDSHIFTVWDNEIHGRIKRYTNTKWKNPLQDYPISTILNRIRGNEKGIVQKIQLQRTGVDFKEQPTPINPYFLGLWLAEGSKEVRTISLSINANDTDLIDFLQNFEEKEQYSVKCSKERGNSIKVNISFNEWQKNPLLKELRAVWESKNFDAYKINSRKVRLELLAGLLDGDGYLGNGCIEITTKYPEINDLTLFLCRSLGLAAYSRMKEGTIKSINFKGQYYRIIISGQLDVIPNKLYRKHAAPRTQIKSVLRTGFSIKEMGQGKWYGFLCVKDHRFLLGDFTIVHNSGKTSTMLECLKRTPHFKKCLFMAFNKSIADELREKVPFGTDVATFHSQAMSVLRKNRKISAKLNENKCFVIGKKLIYNSLTNEEFETEKAKIVYLFHLQELWNQVRINLLTICSEELSPICIEKEIEYRERMVEDLQIIKNEWDRQLTNMNTGKFEIDFSDMLYITYKLLEPDEYPKYDVVFCDETQDTNRIQKELILRYIKPRGRFVVVGDFFQAIYSFQGASVENFSSFINIPNTQVLPLSVTYRCARAIVEEAKKVFPDEITAFDGAVEGLVRQGELKEAEDGDFVLCRNNLPLVEAFIYFTTIGKKATIKGKEFGEALLNLLNKIDSIEGLDDLLDQKLTDLMEKGVSKNLALNHASYVALEEKCMIVRLLYGRFSNFDQLLEVINNLFSNDTKDKGIILCTCHKSKGLEADKVFFLNPELIPSPRAITEKAIYGEKCLKFVAITRAKKELVYCNI